MKKKQNIIPALSDVNVPETANIEYQCIADIVQEPGTMTVFVSLIDAGMFTSDHRKAVYEECLRRFNGGEVIDLPSIATTCGPEFVQHIFKPDEVDDLGFRYAEVHARALRDAAARRKIYMIGLEALSLSQAHGTTEASIYNAMAEALKRLEPDNAKREVELVDVINGIATEIEKRTEDAKDGRPGRITTGMRAIDDVLYGGMAPGQLIIVAARPSIGKTALMLYMARKAGEQKARIALFSIEMTSDELGMRMLASVSEEYDDENYGGMDRPRRSLITPYKLASGFDSNEDWNHFEQAVSQLAPLPIVINDYARDLRDIVSRMTVLHNQGRCDVAYVDYLGLIKQAQANPQTPLYQVIGDITSTLKATAKTLRIPIVLLCQLNREAAKQNKTPQLYNLRDSGSIEQDADVVLMLKQSQGPRLPDLEVWVKKNRQGEKDFGVLMRPNDNYMDFSEQDVIKSK